MPSSVFDRLWRRVDKTETCWNWLGAKDSRGYGRICIGSRSDGTRALVYPHRVSWSEVNGSIPKGMYVCHTCDNPSCVRPDHLFLGTSEDNSKDMSAKGRQRSGYHTQAVWRPHAKLNEQQIKQVRQLYADGESQESAGRKFGVSQVQISRIVKREDWPDIT